MAQMLCRIGLMVFAMASFSGQGNAAEAVALAATARRQCRRLVQAHDVTFTRVASIRTA
jgi:hypothetical protein